MPSKILKIDFYNVEMPQNSEPFEDVLLSIASSPNDASRWEIVRHNPVCLHQIFSNRNLIEGDMVRLRIGDGAIKGRTVDTRLEEIMLQENESLAEPSAFLFHIPTSTLVMERNRIGVSASAMASYCENKSDIKPIIMSPLIQEEAFRKLERLKHIGKFSFRVSGVKNADFLRESGWSGSQVLYIMRAFQAPSIEINLSMGHQRRGSLNIKNTVLAVRQLYENLTNAESNVDKLVITGKTNHDEHTVLDLIKDCIREEEVIEYTNRVPAYEMRRKAVKDSWLKRMDEVNRLRNPGG